MANLVQRSQGVPPLHFTFALWQAWQATITVAGGGSLLSEL